MSDDLVKRLRKYAEPPHSNKVKDVLDIAAIEAADRIEELEAKLAKAVGHIEWLISEDETYRGDVPMAELGNRTWDEINEYWIKHLDSAIEFVAELTKERSDEKGEK